MIIFLYVDDCGIASPDMSEIDAFIDRLKAKGFELTKECNFSAYLGIKFQRNLKNNTITMTRPGLIKKVIEATGMELCSTNKTPTSQTALGSDPEGSPIKETWKYSSVVGMLLYLSTNTRPDQTLCLQLLPSHVEKPTSNRDCTQHLSCRICCPLFSH